MSRDSHTLAGLNLPYDARDLYKLRERTQLMLKELGAVTSVKYVLFSRHVPVDRVLREEIAGGRVIWLGLDNLLHMR